MLALTRKTLGAVPVLREALQALLPGLQSAWVYGSVAKQTDTAQSDIDVMLWVRACSSVKYLAPLSPQRPNLGGKSTQAATLPKSSRAVVPSPTRSSSGCCRSPCCL